MWNDCISDHRGTLVVSSNMSVIGVELNFVLMKSQVKRRNSLGLSTLTHSLLLPHIHLEMLFIDIKV